MKVKSHPPVVQAVLLAALAVLVVPLMCSAQDICPRVKYVTEGDQRLEIGWTLGVADEGNVDGFGGYRVWIREAWISGEFKLEREYDISTVDPGSPADTTWSDYWPFDLGEDSLRVFVKRTAQNAFPYELSVTSFSESNPDSIDYECLERNRTGLVYPRQGQTDDLDYIQVIPNPYRSSADWEYGAGRRVTFVRLPSAATIRIYTVAADLVRTLHHPEDAVSPDTDQLTWDLKNEQGDEVAPGVYIWHVDAHGIGSTEGKVLIMK